MHKNARLTPKGREVLIQRLQAGQRVAEVAQAMGISETTVRKWWRRFRQGESLADRSSRPLHSPRAVAIERRAQIEALRRQRRSGRWIAMTMGLSAATVSRVLRRARLSRWRELEPQPPVLRYERAAAGELIHLDTKKLGRIERPSHRVTGNRRDRVRGIGWEFAHVAIDDHSRTSLVTMAEDERKESAVAFLEQVVEHYRACGIRVQRVMTDNGSAYRSRDFADACRRLQLRHLYTRPYTPQTNGKAERFIQTALREWAYAASYATSQQRREALQDWLHHYNCHRPHSALGGRPPVSRLMLSQNNLLKLHTRSAQRSRRRAGSAHSQRPVRGSPPGRGRPGRARNPSSRTPGRRRVGSPPAHRAPCRTADWVRALSSGGACAGLRTNGPAACGGRRSH